MNRYVGDGMYRGDGDLIRRALQGDQQGFTDLFEKHKNRLYSLIRYYITREDVANDLLQETFIRVFSHLEGCRAETFPQWSNRIAVNLSYDYLRRVKLKIIVMLEDYVFDDLPDIPSHISRPRPLTPEEEYQRTELGGSIMFEVAQLTSTTRSVFVMHHFRQMSQKQISHELGIPLGTVKSRMNRALNVLRDRLSHLKRPIMGVPDTFAEEKL